MVLSVGSIQAANIYVDATLTSGANNGTSWANAFQGVNGLGNALPGTGNTIYVAKGVYKPTSTGDPTKSFQPGSGTTLMGGYNTAVSPPTRDPSAFQSILTGDLNDDDAAVPDLFDNPTALYNLPDRADNTDRLVTLGSPNITLDGFVLTKAAALPSGAGTGAGIQIENANNTTIQNCTFTLISGGSGACINMGGTQTGILIENCIFTQNSNGPGGGGGDAGGSCTLWDGSQATFRNCFWTGNSALGDGVGVYVGHANSGGTATQAFLYDCFMIRNTTLGIISGDFYGRQGVLSARGYDNATAANPCGFWAYNCVMQNNRCRAGSGNGSSGAVMVHGGSDTPIRCVGILENCLISDCAMIVPSGVQPPTEAGVAITVRRVSRADVTNCTMANNSYTASTKASGGVGLYTNQGNDSGANLLMKNSIVWGNTGPNVTADVGATATLRYSCIDDTAGDPNNIHTGTGVITSNPQLDNAFFLGAASPCKNTGNNADVTTALDLSGRPRLNGTVDMGAYEYYRPGDINGSAKVDLFDFELLSAAWLDPDCIVTNRWCGNVDTNHDGNVNSSDFGNLTAAWLQ
jgi:hypothetical protein